MDNFTLKKKSNNTVWEKIQPQREQDFNPLDPFNLLDQLRENLERWRR